MIILSDRELAALKAQLHKISDESLKETQRKRSIYNTTSKAILILKKAERRQKGRINF